MFIGQIVNEVNPRVGLHINAFEQTEIVLGPINQLGQ